ncbi:TetR/AcrR family transcriptional regulator [Kocuria rosea]|uniref:TetR family transcriptional regulator n=1 Tax=Kocuria rosea subsp. polaris TaxID=136273 RepID=A0A0A6VRW7_KOCRO|nr:TetR/AcrR family transcriptional regulator [Kocuria polaris]KHD97366.1 TetR family transcriptional regulator [Kocuria polaris]
MPRVSQQYKDERRREIVAAASECFLEHGYEGASMHRIIAATGLSAGALYNHFPSKQELVAAAVRAALDRVLAAAEDEPGTDPAAWVVGLLERLAADPATTRLLLITWGGAVSDPCLAALAGEHLGRVRDRVEERYGRWAVEELGLDDDAAREWAGMFAQAILSVLQGWVVQSCLLPGFDHGAYLDYARTLAAQ